MHEWYTWRSYHSARKYQRSHAALAGYAVRNLSVIRREAKEAHALWQQSINI
jgi:hypothetical protein